MTATSPRAGDLVCVGDVHLDRDDPALADFLRFLRGLRGNASSLVLAGDLFQLWLGRRVAEGAHQTAVLDALRQLRRAGVIVRYLEGNRDFHVGATYTGDAFDEATDRGVTERFGPRSVFAIHGDLANPHDRRYRAWRRVARSRAAWAAFLLVPPRRRQEAAEAIEARMRASNISFKGSFPEADVRAYAAGFLAAGHDTVVLGHFHVERILDAEPPSPPGRIFVLPEWKGSRRYLRFGADGRATFEDSPA